MVEVDTSRKQQGTLTTGCFFFSPVQRQKSVCDPKKSCVAFPIKYLSWSVESAAIHSSLKAEANVAPIQQDS